MRHIKEIAVAPLGAVLCVCAYLVGCERRETAPSKPPAPAATSSVSRVEVQSKTATIKERANDAAYQKQLDGFVKDRHHIAKRRMKLEARMAQLRERAKKALPAGATEEQVLAELENNPRRYPVWRDLVAARDASVDEEKRNLASARAAVARRILRKEQAGERAQGADPAEK